MLLNAVTTPPITVPTTTDFGQSAVANGLRSAAAGYTASATQAGATVDKATITPFEGVITLTSALKKVTANVPGVSKVTNLVNTVASFGLLIAASTISGSMQAQANTTSNFLNAAADAIDGTKSIAQPSGSLGDAISEALAEADRREAQAAHR